MVNSVVKYVKKAIPAWHMKHTRLNHVLKLGAQLPQYTDPQITLDDIAHARQGQRRLPDKAILITFDDGYRSLYSRVFPQIGRAHV